MNRLAFFALFPTLLLPLACDHRSDPPVAMPSQLVAGPGAPANLAYASPNPIYRQGHSIAPNTPTTIVAPANTRISVEGRDSGGNRSVWVRMIA